RSGAEWWASNPDYSLLTEIGRVPGNGAFVDLISRLTETEPIIVGKPAPHMMEFAAGRLGAHRPLMVGDRLDTDIEGGRAAGLDRKSTRLNSSHVSISYAVFCLKKQNTCTDITISTRLRHTKSM